MRTMSARTLAFELSVFAIDNQKRLSKKKWTRIKGIHDGVFGVISTSVESEE